MNKHNEIPETFLFITYVYVLQQRNNIYVYVLNNNRFLVVIIVLTN